MVKTIKSLSKKRLFNDVYQDYLLIDKSISFLGVQIDSSIEQFDKLIQKNPESEALQMVCGQISYLYKKSLFESKKLEKIGQELKAFGVPIPNKS